MKADKRFGVMGVIAALLISFSRVYLYVHYPYPSDVLVGGILGVIIGLTGMKITAFLLLKWENRGSGAK